MRILVPVPVPVLNHGFVCSNMIFCVVLLSTEYGVVAGLEDLDERVFVWVFFDRVVIHYAD